MVSYGLPMVFLLVSSHFGATATSNHSPRCPSEPQPSVGMQRSQLQRLTNHATAEPAKCRPSCLTMTWRVYESLPIKNMGFILVIYICKIHSFGGFSQEFSNFEKSYAQKHTQMDSTILTNDTWPTKLVIIWGLKTLSICTKLIFFFKRWFHKECEWTNTTCWGHKQPKHGVLPTKIEI